MERFRRKAEYTHIVLTLQMAMYSEYIHPTSIFLVIERSFSEAYTLLFHPTISRITSSIGLANKFVRDKPESLKILESFSEWNIAMI